MRKSERRRRPAGNLTPYTCAGSVEVAESHFCNAPSSLGRRKYTSSRRSLGEDGSRPVLGVKRDIASRMHPPIRHGVVQRSWKQTNRFMFIGDSQIFFTNFRTIPIIHFQHFCLPHSCRCALSTRTTDGVSPRCRSCRHILQLSAEEKISLRR